MVGIRQVAVPAARVLPWTFIARLVLFIALAGFIPDLGLPQQITGPLVNALLFLAAGSLGIASAVAIGAAPSLVAIARGTVPIALLPMVPYIIAGNAVLVVAFSLLRRRGFAAGAAVAALLKFGLLYGAVTYVVGLPQPLATMMQLPQLYTALVGAVIAYGVQRGGVAVLAYLRGGKAR